MNCLEPRKCAPRSKTILLTTKTESVLAALHNGLNGCSSFVYVDSADPLNGTTGLITRLSVPKPRDKFGITIHHEVGVVTCKNDLAEFLRFP